MQQGTTGRSGLVRWIIGLVVIVVLAAGGVVAVRAATGDDAPSQGASGDKDGTDGKGGKGGGTDKNGDDPSTIPDLSDLPEGAAALLPVPEDSPAGIPVDTAPGEIVPNPADGDDDVPDLYADDCQLGVKESTLKECLYGVPVAEAKATIAIVGDSKAAQWLPALQILAQKYKWSLEVYTKSACPASVTPVTNSGQVYRECSEFNRQVRRRLTTQPVDLVFTVSGRGSAIAGRDSDGELKVTDARLVGGLQKMWRIWASVGSKVLVMSDTPKPVDPEDSSDIFDVPQCVEDNTDQLTKCTFDRREGVDIGGFRTQDRAARLVGARNITRALRDGDAGPRSRPDISLLNIIPWVCPTATCPSVIGNVLVYRNGSHLTKTYVETLTPLLEKAFLVIGSEPKPRPTRQSYGGAPRS